MVKENMKNNVNQLYATGKQLDSKAMIFFLYRMTLSIFFFKCIFYGLFMINFPTEQYNLH